MSATEPEITLAEPSTMDPEDRLFTHVKRPEWGIGVWVKEERNRRRLMFADGVRRAFKRGYYDLLKPVDPDKIDVEEEFEQLVADHEAVRDERAARQTPSKPPVMSFDEQLKVFEDLFPGGFKGEVWLEKHRRPDEGRKPRKSHVDPSIEQAQSLLNKEDLSAFIEEGDFDTFHDRVVQVFKRTTLVSPTKVVRPTQALEGEKKAAFCMAIFDLLYGEKRYRRRFGLFVKSMQEDVGFDVNWSLASVLPSLVFPEKHVFVKRRAYVLQAREIKPDARVSKKVQKRAYKSASRIARRVRKQLREKGYEPRDMMDVYLFMWSTLRPMAQKHLDKMKGNA